jgi:hypothetical protein
MAAASYTNAKRFGGLIFYGRNGGEIVLEAGETRVCDIDPNHPPLKAWVADGILVPSETAAAFAAAEAEAARLEAERLAELDKAATIEITAGEARPIT